MAGKPWPLVRFAVDNAFRRPIYSVLATLGVTFWVALTTLLMSLSDQMGYWLHLVQQLAAQPDIRQTLAPPVLASLGLVFAFLNRSLFAISLIAAVAGGTSILLFMLTSTNERMREFAILKAIGWSNRDILLSVSVESLILTLTGALWGFGLGSVVIIVLRWLIAPDLGRLSFGLAAMIGLLVLLVGLASGFYPALKAARVSPAEAWRGA